MYQFVRISGVPPTSSARPSVSFHAFVAAARTPSKSQPGISAARLRAAASGDTVENATFIISVPPEGMSKDKIPRGPFSVSTRGGSW